MFDVLIMVLAFLVAITLLIAVHEFGHFWVAKRLGVKVLRYSIGFGRPLWRRVYGADQTEYVIAAIPLGGYVKMLDEREGTVPEQERNRAFNNKPLATRFAVVLAGPMFNFLFAIFAYWMWFVLGVTGVKPVIGEVIPDSPAAYAQLKSNQEIVSVNDEPTPIWTVAIQAMLPALLGQGEVTLQLRDADGSESVRVLDFSDMDPNTAPERPFQSVGVLPWREPAPPRVLEVFKGTPAERAGFKVGDKVVSIDDQQINSTRELVDYVSARPEQTLWVRVERADQGFIDLEVRPDRKQVDGKDIGQIGLAPGESGGIPDDMKVHYRYPVLDAIPRSIEQTWKNSVLTLQMLYKIVIGDVSVKNLSGPINIAKYAGQSATAGLPWFLNFLAIVSISLGIINLLPIPVLDGGHLMYYVIEFFKGKPVSEEFEAAAQRVGILLIVLLMGLAFYNDLVRLFG